jgi:hypothetical protein
MKQKSVILEHTSQLLHRKLVAQVSIIRIVVHCQTCCRVSRACREAETLPTLKSPVGEGLGFVLLWVQCGFKF